MYNCSILIGDYLYQNNKNNKNKIIGEYNMKKLAIIFAVVVSTSAFATVEDGVEVLGATPTDTQIEMVRAGAKKFCSDIEEYEVKEQCAMDYYAQHNFEGEPDCE
jgi:hypothetical protein